jgi:hypothetical protein
MTIEPFEVPTHKKTPPSTLFPFDLELFILQLANETTESSGELHILLIVVTCVRCTAGFNGSLGVLADLFDFLLKVVLVDVELVSEPALFEWDIVGTSLYISTELFTAAAR